MRTEQANLSSDGLLAGCHVLRLWACTQMRRNNCTEHKHGQEILWNLEARFASTLAELANLIVKHSQACQGLQHEVSVTHAMGLGAKWLATCCNNYHVAKLGSSLKHSSNKTPGLGFKTARIFLNLCISAGKHAVQRRHQQHVLRSLETVSCIIKHTASFFDCRLLCLSRGRPTITCT